jgi:hypothetical protein
MNWVKQQRDISFKFRMSMSVMLNMKYNSPMVEVCRKCTQDGTGSGNCKEQRPVLMANPFVCNFDLMPVPTISEVSEL